VVGVAVLVSGRGDRKSAVPFGPFLLVGALVGLVIGPIVGSAYVEIFQL
jgi:leader peptidase (prepilin peptidase) / N-methyltransferase